MKCLLVMTLVYVVSDAQNTTEGPTPTTTEEPPEKCPLGLTYFNGTQKCYFASTTLRSWEDARSFCKLLKGDLVVIRNKELNTFVNALIKPNISYWIGLNDLLEEGVWRWLNENKEISFQNWKPGEPNNDGTEDCVFITVDKVWNDIECGAKMGAVCERNSVGMPTTPPEVNPTKTPAPVEKPVCPEGWKYFQKSQKCYRETSERSSWYGSRSLCIDIGGDLATIRNRDESAFVGSLIVANREHWIGFNDLEQEGDWRWLEEDAKPTFTNWNPGDPNNAGTEDCAYITGNNRWNDRSCGDKILAFCERPAEKPHCLEGWRYLEKSQKCYRQTTQYRSWYDSRKLCMEAGGDLATIRNGDESAFVSRMNVKGAMWIGLSDQEREGNWRWLDESVNTGFTNWVQGEPNNANGKEDCVYILDSHVWNDSPCSTGLKAFCERPAENAQCPQTWIYNKNGHKCYLLSKQGRTWEDSRSFCKQGGSDLATIKNSADNGFVNGLVDSLKGRYWIGLNDLLDEGRWTWLNEPTEVTISNWNVGQPDNYEEEDCVHILPVKKWNDNKCHEEYWAICELPTGTEYEDCPNGWYYQENGKKCYLMEQQARTWQNSRYFCQQKGGDLATIKTGADVVYVNALIDTSTGTYWIGLNDLSKEGRWTWLDEQTEITFSNWKPGQPDNHEDEDCGEILTDDLWNDSDCNTKLGAICQRPSGYAGTRTTQTDSLHCPNGWKYNKDNQKCYMQTLVSRTWQTSRIICEKAGGDLATIRDGEENTFIANMLKSAPGTYWIGLNDLIAEGKWRWLNEPDQITFSNWKQGEPNNSGNEDCGFITNAHKWNDFTCFAHMRAVCERPAANYTGQADRPY